MSKTIVNKAQYINLLQDALAAHPDFKPGMQIFSGPESGAAKSNDIAAFHYLPQGTEMNSVIGQLLVQIDRDYEVDVFAD